MKQNITFTAICAIIGLMLLPEFVRASECPSGSSYKARMKESVAYSTHALAYYHGYLSGLGCDANDVECIKRILADSDWNKLKYPAIYMLAYEMGPEAIPYIKPGLDSSHPQNRTAAAEAMALLGDRSGLEILRKDFAEFVEDMKEKKENKPKKKMTYDERTKTPLYRRSTPIRIMYVTDAASVLARCGETSVFEFAAQSALEDNRAMFRDSGIKILVNLAKYSDEDVLKSKGIDPVAVLLAVAEIEKDQNVVRSLSSMVGNLKPESRIRIYEKIILSPHVSEEQKQTASRSIRRAQKQLEMQKKSKDVKSK